MHNYQELLANNSQKLKRIKQITNLISIIRLVLFVAFVISVIMCFYAVVRQNWGVVWNLGVS